MNRDKNFNELVKRNNLMSDLENNNYKFKSLIELNNELSNDDIDFFVCNEIARIKIELSNIRKQKNISKSCLAELMNTNISAITKFEENGIFPSINFIIKYCKAINIKINFI